MRVAIEEQGATLLDRHIFRDDGYSGAALRRRGLDRLRDAVAAGEVDQVLLTTPDRLARNRQFARRNNTAHEYLLRALVSCGACQAACTGRSDRRHRYDYYVCRAKAHPVASRREVRCPARYIPAQQLDDLVWQDLCAVLTHPESIAQALERAQGGHWSSQEG